MELILKNEAFTPIHLFRDDPGFPAVRRAVRTARWHRWFDVYSWITPLCIGIATLIMYVGYLDATSLGKFTPLVGLLLGQAIAWICRRHSPGTRMRKNCAQDLVVLYGMVKDFDTRVEDFNYLCMCLPDVDSTSFTEQMLLDAGHKLGLALDRAVAAYESVRDGSFTSALMSASKSDSVRL